MRARALLALVPLTAAAVVFSSWHGGRKHPQPIQPQIAYAAVDPFATTLPPDKRALESSGWAHGRAKAPDPRAKTAEVAKRPNPGPDGGRRQAAEAGGTLMTGVIESGQSPFGPSYRFRNRWQAQHGSTLRQVFAGAMGTDPSRGVAVVVVRAWPSGAVRSTRVLTPAGRHGALRIVATHGRVLTLRAADGVAVTRNAN
jgi:hypothetical protein